MAVITEQNRRWWALGALSASLFMIMLDNTVVSVALPSIQRDLGTSLSQLEWVINAYAMVFAVLLIPGGKLADYLGRRRIFVIGLVIFTAASLACGLSNSGGALIASRAVQGIGAALMLPATLSIITATFPVKERGLAIGIWSGVSGVALAIGPLVGGLLAQHAGWEWIFFVNIPVGVAGLFLTFWLVRESRDMSPDQRLDFPGLVLAGLGVFLFTYGLTEANSYGWGSTRIILCFVGGAVAIGLFVLVELRQRRPLLDLSLFKNPTFSAGNIGGMLMFLALFGQIFFSSLYLQAVLRYSAVQAGSTFLVATGCVAITAPISGILSDKIGARIPTAVGMAIYGVGMLGLSTVDATSNFWDLFPWLFIGGLGFGLIVPAITAAVLGSVSVDQGGVASGTMQAFRQLGGGLGVAIMGAIVASKVGDLRPGTLLYAREFVGGYQNAMLFGAIVSFASAVIAVAFIRRHESMEAPEPAGLGI
jgi:EmrB/QacA subfamily drug resistance transporter